MAVFSYAAMHFLVDFVCAWAMFSFFSSGPEGYLNILIYNFCAFALQLPLGTLLDLQKDRRRLPLIWSVSGAALTVAGALIHPAVLGLGNALFHVGGGMDVIHGDFAHNRKGADLGVFVAPGALGLYLGGLIGRENGTFLILLFAALLLVGPACLLFARHEPAAGNPAVKPCRNGTGVLIVCCFAVVVLRSWAGLSISFSWKAELGLVSVLAVALGKAAGGILAVKFGVAGTMTTSLLLSSLCFLLGNHPVFGILALFLFNMTMPVTLYMLAKNLPHLAGFSFGLLTFGLFLGFLPVYAGFAPPLSPAVFGFLVSLISLALLWLGRKAVKAVVLS